MLHTLLRAESLMFKSMWKHITEVLQHLLRSLTAHQFHFLLEEKKRDKEKFNKLFFWTLKFLTVERSKICSCVTSPSSEEHIHPRSPAVSAVKVNILTPFEVVGVAFATAIQFCSKSLAGSDSAIVLMGSTSGSCRITLDLQFNNFQSFTTCEIKRKILN